jgi:gas vesicle protein
LLELRRKGDVKMMIRELIHRMDMEKKKKARAEKIHKCLHGLGMVAVGVALGVLAAPKVGKETGKDKIKEAGNKAKTVKAAVQQKAMLAMDSVSRTKKEVHKAMKDVNEATENAKEDIKNEHQEIKQNVNKTAKKISR